MKALIIIPAVFLFHTLFEGKESSGNIPKKSSCVDTLCITNTLQERIQPPLGYAAIKKISRIGPLLKELGRNDIQSIIERFHFDSSLAINNKIFGAKSKLRLEDYYNAPINKDNFNLYDIRLSTKYLYTGSTYLYFISVKDKNQYSKMNKLYLASIVNGQVADIKLIYNETQHEMGFADYTLFYIDRNYAIDCRDYKVTEEPLKAGIIKRYKINSKGRFFRIW